MTHPRIALGIAVLAGALLAGRPALANPEHNGTDHVRPNQDTEQALYSGSEDKDKTPSMMPPASSAVPEPMIRKGPPENNRH